MNSDAFREMFGAIDAGEWDCLRRFFANEIIYERPGYEPLLGLDEVLEFYRTVRIVESGRHDLYGIMVQQEAASCWGRFTGVSRDGTRLDERFADIYTLRSGVITNRSTYFFRAAI